MNELVSERETNMEISSKDEEKYVKIRQTVRKFILPLVQEIYHEDPEDVISFCSGYFDRLLKERSEKDAAGLNYNYPGEINLKDEKGGNAKSTTDDSQMLNASSSNIQGSASESLLISNREHEGLSLRETSSWNLTSNHSRSTGLNKRLGFNIADAKSRIGDQPSLTVENTALENLEREVKSGDVNVSQKDEKAFKDDNYIENEASNQTVLESSTREVKSTCILPSAPPEEIVNGNSKGLLEEDNKQFHENLNVRNMKNPVNTQEMKLNNVSEYLKNVDLSCSTTHRNSSEENKLFNKQLSPNSSFGFVPHLSECEEELRKANSEYYDDLNNKRKADEATKELKKKVSDTLQSLAQEFTSAEDNFNEKFYEVKEISEVLNEQHNSKGNGCSKITQETDQNNDIVKRRKELNEHSNFVEKRQPRDGSHHSENDASNRGCEPKGKKSPENFTKKSSNLKNTGGLKHVRFQENTCDTTYELVKDSPNFRNSEVQNFNQHHEQNSSRQTLDETSESVDELRQNVDESWRRRWYESHPRLDCDSASNSRYSCMYLPFNASGRTGALHNIGEGGDVPVFYTAQDDLNENFDDSAECSFAAVPSRENNEHGALSPDEILRRNSGNVSRSFPVKDHASNISSQHVPYSWRQMCKPQACSSGNKDKRPRQTEMRPNEDILDSGKDPKQELNSNVYAGEEAEVLSEVIVVTEEKAEAESPDGSGNISSSKPVNNQEGNGTHLAGKNYSGNNGTSKPLETETENLSKNHQQEDSSHGFSEGEVNNVSFQRHEAANDDSDMKKAMKMLNDYSGSLVVNKEVNESHRSESLEKVEPGLISACGDFSSTAMNDNNEQPPAEVTEENNANNGEQNQAPAVGITEEYLEEVLGRVIEQREEDFKDSYETLNFSSYSESDKSSDYSETDEFEINNST